MIKKTFLPHLPLFLSLFYMSRLNKVGNFPATTVRYLISIQSCGCFEYFTDLIPPHLTTELFFHQDASYTSLSLCRNLPFSLKCTVSETDKGHQRLVLHFLVVITLIFLEVAVSFPAILHQGGAM